MAARNSTSIVDLGEKIANEVARLDGVVQILRYIGPESAADNALGVVQDTVADVSNKLAALDTKKPAIKKLKLSSNINVEAARLAGVAEILQRIRQEEDDSVQGNRVHDALGLLEKIVDEVNVRLSALAARGLGQELQHA